MDKNNNKMINVVASDHYKIKKIALEERTTIKKLITKMIKLYEEKN